MKKMDDATVAEDVGEITKKQILSTWCEGKTISQSAKELSLPIEVVSRSLKRMQRAMIDQGDKSLGE